MSDIRPYEVYEKNMYYLENGKNYSDINKHYFFKNQDSISIFTKFLPQLGFLYIDGEKHFFKTLLYHINENKIVMQLLLFLKEMN